MKKILFAYITVCILISCALPAGAWTNHALLTYMALKDLPGMSETVTAEPIEIFLLDEKDRIGPLLDKEEAWARKNIRAYSPRPESLKFVPGSVHEMRERFLMALRLNPGMRFALFIQPRDLKDPRPRIAWDKISLYPTDYVLRPMVEIRTGEKVNALEVIATASDEPDYGYDLGLHSDNGTPYGRLYGYGPQPISDPKEFTYSQAGFHMGFYHESWIVFAAAPSLKKTCPIQRAHLFFTLSRFAFETGHPYWGCRFAGMALHYTADLNMPYHACTVPGVSTLKLLWYSVLKAVGIDGPYKRTLDEVTNAHILLETYVYDSIRPAFDRGDFSSPLLAALADRSGDGTARACDERYLEDVVAGDAYDAASDIADALMAIVGNRKLFDNAGKLSVKGYLRAEEVMSGSSEKNRKKFFELVRERMKKQGAYLRACVSTVMKGIDLSSRYTQ